MGFLNKARRRAAHLHRDTPTNEAGTVATRERLEPQLDPTKGASEPTDPEIRRMAQAFEALYSPPKSPTDRHSMGRTDNDNFFAEMTQESNLAAAPGDAAVLKREPRDSDRKTSAVRHDVAPAAEPAGTGAKKTTIEMVFEMRRAAEEKTARTATPPPRAMQQVAPAPEAHSAPQLEAVPEHHAIPRAEAVVQSPPEPQSVAVAPVTPHGSKEQETEAHARWASERQQVVHSTEWSSRHRRIHLRMLAGAALVLVVGTGLGYMAGKGDEPMATRAAVESSGNGVKLRLDRDLRQQ
jgi:hypothetical protein